MPERGSVSVLLLLVCVGLCGSVLLIVGMLRDFVTVARLQAVADLAALAAVAGAFHSADPCARARSVAHSNGAALSTCLHRGVEVDVMVEGSSGRSAAASAALLTRTPSSW